jgi:hypothetical protein
MKPQIPGSSARLNRARGAGVGVRRRGGGPAAAFVGSGPAHGTAIATGRRPRVRASDFMVSVHGRRWCEGKGERLCSYMEAKNKVIAVCSKRLAAVLDSETSAMGAGWIITS